MIQERDVDAIRSYLASFDVFAGNEAEGQSYINLALQRFLITLAMIPQAASGGRLLELGGNPYFLTLLIKRFRSYEITLANYFGAAGPANGRGKQIIRSEHYGEAHEFEYDHFNGEVGEFPYPDHSFDVVLNCEILEHLTLDPTAYLCECQRVLKPGGALLLTTPNVLAFQNLWRLGANRNVYDQYSGYGVYGRHNREYTPRELVELVEGCGFTLEQIKIADIYPSRGLTRMLKRVRQHWRDNLFLVARAKGRPIYYYPGWLYRSMGSLRHVRRPDIVMGENDAVQIGDGWHPLERLPYPARWSSGRSVAYLRTPARSNRFTLEVNPVRPTAGDVTLTLDIAGSVSSHRIETNEWKVVAIPTPEVHAGEVQVALSVSPTFNPKLLGINEDNRELGVLVKHLGFESTSESSDLG
jgi:SAM-dependent methyltransferase